MSHTRPLRFAVVGCGRMGCERARAAVTLGATLVVACDIEVQRAKDLVALYQNGVAVDNPAKIEWPGLDAVFICTPPFARGNVEVAAVRAGVPIFLEKPIGVTALAADSLVEALNEHRVINAVGYMNRYRDSVNEARRLARDRGVLGLSCNWVAGEYRVWWRQSEEHSGGGMNDEATHLVDLARYLVGEIAEVQALPDHPGRAPGSRSGTVAGILRFEMGQLGTLLYSGRASGKQIALRLHTPVGELRLESWDFDLLHDDGKVLGRPCGTDRGNIFHAEVQAFMDAVATSDISPIRSTVMDAIRTQRVIDALRESRSDGRPRLLG